jgi:protein-S-isoprenylcysteine O-methyltransferase Ste14
MLNWVEELKAKVPTRRQAAGAAPSNRCFTEDSDSEHARLSLTSLSEGPRFSWLLPLWIETTTQLVTTGAFKDIRHPLYSSLLLLAWGVFFKHPSWGAGGVVVGATALLLATAKVEEVENIRYFGAAYRAYMQRTKMFIPFVF